MNPVNKTDRPKRVKNVDFRVYYDIVKLTNNHVEWHERSGLMTARHPFSKGANVSPYGNHVVKMANGIIRPHHCVRFFGLRSRSPPTTK